MRALCLRYYFHIELLVPSNLFKVLIKPQRGIASSAMPLQQSLCLHFRKSVIPFILILPFALLSFPLSDGLSRDTHPRKSYDQALMDGIKQAIALLS